MADSTDPAPDDIVLASHVMCIAMHPSAPVVAASSVTGEVQLHQYAVEGGNKLLSHIGHHTESCRALQFSPNGQTLYSGGKDSVIGAFDLNSMKSSGLLTKAHDTAISSLLVIDDTTLVSGYLPITFLSSNHDAYRAAAHLTVMTMAWSRCGIYDRGDAVTS
jgi:WD40 repeat protein